MNLKQKSGFTLLEIIIVIIIVGVLASLALPRLFSTVEFSRSGEALAAFSSLRSSLERCYLQNSSYNTCTIATIDLTDPGNSPNAHFTYGISAQNATGYLITATRITRDGGNPGDLIHMTQTSASVTKDGTSAFVGLK